MEGIRIEHHPESRRFSTTVDGCTASLDYRRVSDTVLEYSRTFVPVEIRQRGIAKTMTVYALEYAAARGLKVIPSCWFVAKIMQEDPAFAGLEAGD